MRSEEEYFEMIEKLQENFPGLEIPGFDPGFEIVFGKYRCVIPFWFAELITDVPQKKENDLKEVGIKFKEKVQPPFKNIERALLDHMIKNYFGRFEIHVDDGHIIVEETTVGVDKSSKFLWMTRDETVCRKIYPIFCRIKQERGELHIYTEEKNMRIIRHFLNTLDPETLEERVSIPIVLIKSLPLGNWVDDNDWHLD